MTINSSAVVYTGVSRMGGGVDSLILSRSQALGYCLKDQMNNRQWTSPPHAISNLPQAVWKASLSTSSILLLHSPPTTSHPSSTWPLSSSHSLSARVLLRPSHSICPLLLRGWDYPTGHCPDCSKPIILWSCLPSSHLAPQHSKRDFGVDSCLWQSEDRQSGWWDGGGSFTHQS